MTTQLELEVIGVQRVKDVTVNATQIQVLFGHPTDVTPDMVGKLQVEPGKPSPVEAYTNVLQVTLPFEEAHKYTVGSRWQLRVDEQGAIQLTPHEEPAPEPKPLPNLGLEI